MRQPSSPFRPSRRDLMGAGIAAAAVSALPLPSAHAKAPFAGPSRALYRRFAFGQFEITTIFDGAITIDGPHPIFGENQPLADVQALARDNFLPDSTMQVGFTPVVVNTGANLVLFDTGNGAARRPNAGLLGERLTAAGINPADIDTIVITHCHPDHIGGLMEAGQPAFPKARLVINEAEWAFWSAEDKLQGATERTAKVVQANLVPLKSQLDIIKAGADVVAGIRTVDLSGHTPGMMGAFIESGGKTLMLVADLTNHAVMSLQRPNWHVRFDMDKERAGYTRRTVLQQIAAERMPFIGYHMPFPAVGFVEAAGDGFRYVPMSYQFDL